MRVEDKSWQKITKMYKNINLVSYCQGWGVPFNSNIIVKKAIEMLMDKPLIKTDLSSTAEVTLRKQDDSYIVHMLNYIPIRKSKQMDIIEEVLPMYNKSISVKCDKKPSKVYCCKFFASGVPTLMWIF